MAESPKMPEPTTSLSDVEDHLTSLTLAFIAAQYAELAKHAAHKAWSHVDYLASLVEGEADLRRGVAPQNRLGFRRFPAPETPDPSRSGWPTRINPLPGAYQSRLALFMGNF